MRAGGTAPAPRCEYRSLRGPVKGFALGGSLPARRLAGSPFRPRPSGDRPAPLPVLTANGAGAEVWPSSRGLTSPGSYQRSAAATPVRLPIARHRRRTAMPAATTARARDHGPRQSTERKCPPGLLEAGRVRRPSELAGEDRGRRSAEDQRAMLRSRSLPPESGREHQRADRLLPDPLAAVLAGRAGVTVRTPQRPPTWP